MPEDNRFAGLSDAVEDEEPTDGPDDESDEGAAPDTESTTADDSSGDGEPTTEVEYESVEADAESDEETEQSETGSGAENSSDGDADVDDPTAFPFDATEKKTVYVRSGTLDDLEDARALVDAQLRTEHDVRDLTGREFYDAAFRLAAADTDGLIDEILEARDA
ncbi:hypothetical protein [Natronorubrum sp. FCH18a]|uniref:hypothetical protein n=1 Tax=Natronorubrum sp. FCH18a TaxID=3447018 RepID=UPI003F5137CA